MQAETFSSASFQHGVVESRLTWMSPEASLPTLDAGYPCRHDELSFSFSAAEHKITNHFVFRPPHPGP